MKYVFLYTLCLPLWLWAAQTTIQLTAEEERWITEHPVISVANDSAWAPFDFTKDGKAQGLGVDYITAIAHKVGLQVNFVQAPWDELFDRFKVRNIDVVHSIYKTPDREKFALFTQPFYKNANAIAARKGVSITTLEDFTDKRIAIIKGHGLSEALIKEVPSIHPIMVNDLKEALHAVSFDQADAVVSSLGAISYIVMEEALANLDIKPFASLDKHVSSQLYFATNPNKVILRNILDKGLEAITPQEQMVINSHWLIQQKSNNLLTTLTLTDEELQWLHDHPSVRFVGKTNYLPYEAFQEDGTHVGILSEHLNEIEKNLAIHIEKKPIHSSEEIIEKITHKEVDIFTSFKDDHTFDTTHIQIETDIKSPVVIVGKRQYEF